MIYQGGLKIARHDHMDLARPCHRHQLPLKILVFQQTHPLNFEIVLWCKVAMAFARSHQRSTHSVRPLNFSIGDRGVAGAVVGERGVWVQ
jgi:hypothetical protein